MFQGTRCNACSQKLDFPSIHFLCQHSFHQQCFDSFAANDKDCPVCWQRNRELLETERAELIVSKAALDAEFTNKVNTAKSNSFAILAEAFSKGVFKDEEKPREAMGPKRSLEKLRNPSAHPFEARDGTSEARLRLNEGSMGYSSETTNPTGPAPIESLLETMKQSSSVVASTGFEGRRELSQAKPAMSFVPFPRQSGTISSAISEQSPRLPSKKVPLSISAAVQQLGKVQRREPKNPFEEEEDEDALNPFLESESPSVSKNPFEEDDYDPSLNPFTE